MVVDWDGKMLPDLIGKTKVERIAILVSYNNTSTFLGAPKLDKSTGKNIAAAVHSKLVEWNITKQVSAIGFDTTSNNTGVNSGACVEPEKLLVFLKKKIALSPPHS